MTQVGLGNLQRETTDNLHIRRYDKNFFLLTNDAEYRSPIAIFNEEIYTDILPASFDELTAEHYEKWLALKPTLILVSTGDEMKFLDPKWQAFFYQHKIGIDVMPTASLCRTFTILAVEERNALGIFFPLTKEVEE